MNIEWSNTPLKVSWIWKQTNKRKNKSQTCYLDFEYLTDLYFLPLEADKIKKNVQETGCSLYM